MKRGLLLLAAAVLTCALLFTGCSSPQTPKRVTGLNITIPSYFTDMLDGETMEGMDFAYTYFDMTIYGIQEKFDLFEDNLPADEAAYAQQIIQANKLDTQVETLDGITAFRFESLKDEIPFTTLVAVFTGTDAYWRVEMSCQSDTFETNLSRFRAILATVSIPEETTGIG